MKKFLCLLMSLILLSGMLVSCDKTDTSTDSSEEEENNVSIPDGYVASETVTNYVMINVSGYGKIIVELYPDVAPKSVENFQNLVSEGFYNGLIFHRIIEGFMIQGGDPDGNGTGGSDTKIEGEFALNGYNNTLKHERGVISMARSGSSFEQYLAYGYTYDQLSQMSGMSVSEIKANIKAACNSASSQFFIVHQTSTHLDGNYAAFGKVVYGMDVVDKIAVVEKDSNDKPLKDVKMKSVSFVSVAE